MKKKKKQRHVSPSLTGFLILLAVCAALYLGMDSTLPGFLGLILFVYLGICALLCAAAGKKLTCSMQQRETGGGKRQTKVQLEIQNHSILPVIMGTVLVRAENVLTGSKEAAEIPFSLMPKGIKRVSFAVGDQYCGCIRIQVAGAVVSDPLQIFSGRRNMSSRAECYLLPAVSELEISREELSRYDMESYVYSSERKGDDPSETFGLRSYRPGDSIKTIHWKLSGKMDDLVIRELGLPVENRVMLILDMRRDSETDPSPEQIQRSVELFVSLSYTAAKQGIVHTAGWYQAEKGRFEAVRIGRTEDVFQMLPSLLSSPFHEDGLSAAERFLESELEKKYAGYLYVTVEGAEEDTERLNQYGKVIIYRA